MSSRRAEARPYSLTRRLATRFAVTTCALVLLYALLSAWFVVAQMRSDLLLMLEHETEELASDVEHSDGSHAGYVEALQRIAMTVEEPPTGFRLRDGDGQVLAESGDRHLLLFVTDPVRPETSWRTHLFSGKLAVAAAPVPGSDMLAEVYVDVQPTLARLGRYFLFAMLAFLLAVVLATFGGWFTASRGMRSLHEVVRQAGVIDPVMGGASIRIEDAPVEVAAVGGALNGMLERIDAGLVRMRTFTASLAHELRSPLQNLIGETEVNLLSPRSVTEYQALLSSNLEELHALSDAVDNLVAWCRSAEPEKRATQRELFDLAGEAELRLVRERQTARRERVNLLLTSEGDTRLWADREGALRMLRNLVRNAIAWSPPDGTVHVHIQGVGTPGPDGGPSSYPDGEVRVVVDDEGPGIPDELRSRVFEPFVSGRPRERHRGGYGLGLAISRSVMEDHAGRLSFERRDGQGTRFVARFPRRSAA